MLTLPHGMRLSMAYSREPERLTGLKRDGLEYPWWLTGHRTYNKLFNPMSAKEYSPKRQNVSNRHTGNAYKA
jgi:hypothetical protein